MSTLQILLAVVAATTANLGLVFLAADLLTPRGDRGAAAPEPEQALAA